MADLIPTEESLARAAAHAALAGQHPPEDVKTIVDIVWREYLPYVRIKAQLMTVAREELLGQPNTPERRAAFVRRAAEVINADPWVRANDEVIIDRIVKALTGVR